MTRQDTDKCARCAETRLVHRTTKNANCPVFVETPAAAPAATIRYEIESNLPGLVIRAPGIVGVCASRGRSEKSIAVVYVAAECRDDFEKAVEGNMRVTGYRADPNADKEETARARKAGAR